MTLPYMEKIDKIHVLEKYYNYLLLLLLSRFSHVWLCGTP